MIKSAFKLFLPGFLVLSVWLIGGCAEQRNAEQRADQTHGYVEPEQRYSERDYQEHFHPQVPKMY